MRKPTLIESRDVALVDIFVENRLRETDDVLVTALAGSIEEIGLKDRITLRRVRRKGVGAKGGSGYVLVLVAGAHRMAACHQLGHEAIPADIWDCTDDYARLLEIDDNLARAELTPLDRAVFLCRRKDVYEQMYPETKAATGADLVAKRWDTADIMSVVSFVAATAKQTGQTERHIRRMIAVADGLSQDEIDALRAAPIRVSIADLQVLAKCNPKHRPHIVFGLLIGAAKSAGEALDILTARPGDAVVDPVDAKVRPLNDMFARANKAVLHRFVRHNAPKLRAILDSLDGDA
ncbi:ParB N-terminal domain-containing protein [uncultured Tateyamaria sp.]|uniref:ParB/RepB/Spo0J family partition protein n=1 Tax=uncultured Tateyamaria sp. TaxID=455651 RepID=UPI00260F2093|nr:ParB N-terminal domain-containing protein [uncultured Tateyamaria sp.]